MLTSFRQAYQARAETALDVRCLPYGLRSRPENCTINTPLPVRVKAQWIPRGETYPNAQRLVPKPTTAIIPSGLNPPPIRDCTDISFAYPDWYLHDFTYVQPTVANDPETANLTYSVTSRATGVRVHCFWGKAYNVTWRDQHVGDYYMWPSCDPDNTGPDPMNSQTVYTMGYNRDARTLKIQQEWVCGDTAGKYSCVQPSVLGSISSDADITAGPNSQQNQNSNPAWETSPTNTRPESPFPAPARSALPIPC